MESPTCKVPFCTRTVATGPLPLSSCASITRPLAFRLGLAFSSFTSAVKRIISRSSGIPSFVWADTGNEYGAAAPVLGNQLILGQLLFYTLHIGAGLIDLVDCNNDLHTCGLGMVDGLHGLGHYAVVRCHHQNRDIRSLGAPHTHGGERLMARVYPGR